MEPAHENLPSSSSTPSHHETFSPLLAPQQPSSQTTMTSTITGPGSGPGTPSEVPGTPLSTTPSLASAISTTAIKEGHHGTILHRDNERAIRLGWLESLDAFSGPGLRRTANTSAGAAGQQKHARTSSEASTPTSSSHIPASPTTSGVAAGFTGQGYQPGHYYYFDSLGQPRAVTQVSTIGTASETETDRSGKSQSLADDDDGEDILASTDSHSVSASADTGVGGRGSIAVSASGAGTEEGDGDNDDLVEVGEGAGSTLSGPVCNRHVQQQGQQYQEGMRYPGTAADAARAWAERAGLRSGDAASESPQHPSTSSGREIGSVQRGSDREHGTLESASDPILRERHSALMVDGIAVESGTHSHGSRSSSSRSHSHGVSPLVDDGEFVDTSLRGPVPVEGDKQEEQGENVAATTSSPTMARVIGGIELEEISTGAERGGGREPGRADVMTERTRRCCGGD